MADQTQPEKQAPPPAAEISETEPTPNGGDADIKDVKSLKSDSLDSDQKVPQDRKGSQDLEEGRTDAPKLSLFRRYRSQIRIVTHLVIWILFTG
jgi:hypothetical protein